MTTIPIGNTFTHSTSQLFIAFCYRNLGRIAFFGVKTMTRLFQFLHDESGATAIEYGLIAAGISVAIIGAVTALGTQLGSTFNYVNTTLASAGTAGK